MSFDWADDDYAVVDDTVIGRIYMETIHGGTRVNKTGTGDDDPMLLDEVAA